MLLFWGVAAPVRGVVAAIVIDARLADELRFRVVSGDMAISGMAGGVRAESGIGGEVRATSERGKVLGSFCKGGEDLAIS